MKRSMHYMLILDRHSHDEILIGQDITIHVVKVGTGRVRLGIEAPEGTVIMRAELLKQPDKCRKILRGRFSGSKRSKERRHVQ